ncbi:MAG TPA: alpha/beta hydrolase [Hyphomicrobiales bacterium]|nr:alpha/beta hydrolase [Hyphomicrobiales bacterium]
MRGLFILALALVSFAATASSGAEEVYLEHLGLDLSANLETAPGKSLKSDGAVLLVHDTLGHDRMELMSALQDALRDLGMNSLAITLGLGMDRRHGMFDCAIEQDHRHEDAVEEIAAWVHWLKEKGANTITVAGHGRGANQVALYAINRLDKAVKRVILMSPLMQTEEKAEAEYRARFGSSLRQELAKAEELVANEGANQLVNVPGFLNCTKPIVTAGAFANYYGVNEKFQTTNLLPSIKIPVLLAVGNADPNLKEIMAAERELGISKNVILAVIPGADQDFSDLGADELAKKIKEFIGHKLQG